MKPVRWIGDSRRRLCEFPRSVRSEIGQALYEAQLGEGHRSAQALQSLQAVEIGSGHRGLIRRRLVEARLHFQGYTRERNQSDKTN